MEWYLILAQSMCSSCGEFSLTCSSNTLSKNNLFRKDNWSKLVSIMSFFLRNCWCSCKRVSFRSFLRLSWHFSQWQLCLSSWKTRCWQWLHSCSWNSCPNCSASIKYMLAWQSGQKVLSSSCLFRIWNIDISQNGYKEENCDYTHLQER